MTDAEVDPGVEARTPNEAARAVSLFNEGLREGPGVLRQVAERAQLGAETISSDRLQVLSEMVQNADDAGARDVRLHWRPTELLIGHNGSGLRLADILRLGLPWLSGKSLDADATGRFGIGLATLRLLSTSWEVHGNPYHVRFADVTLAPADPPRLPPDLSDPEWTVFRIPLEPGALSAEALFSWFESWQDSSLLFLRHVEQVTVLADGSAGATATRVLRLSWHDAATLRLPMGKADCDVRVREARTSDGKSWRVYDTLVPTEGGWQRLHKKLGPTVPVAVALPLYEAATGSVHAGLPVAPLAAAARVHSQFDPVVSREGFAASSLNTALVPVVADLWQAAVLDVLARVDPSAWHLLPLPELAAPDRAGLPGHLRAAFLERARDQVATVLTLRVPAGAVVPLADLAVEAEELSGVISERDTARLAGLEYTFPHLARDRAGRWREVLADWRDDGSARLTDEVEVRDALGLLQLPTYAIDRTVRLTAVALAAGLDYLVIHRSCLATADGRRLAPSSAEYAIAHSEGTGPLDPVGILCDLHPAYWADDDAARRVVTWLRQRNRLVRRDDTAAILRRIAQLGAAGGRLPTTGASGTEQLVLLQRALGELPKAERDKLGPDIGRTVELDAYEYGPGGEEKTCQGPPNQLYLSQPLESTDGDRFAVAARRTTGLLWAHRSYAKTLLPASQSGGLSRTAFLRLLGVADVPRLAPILLDPPAVKTYESRDRRSGLFRGVILSTDARGRRMRELRADYTLDDRISGDLDRVVRDISAERDVTERRRRTAALLQTLGRPGMLTSPDHAVVQAANAYHGWTLRGPIPALWVWRLRAAAWLEDAGGTLRRPGELQLRTPDAVALYGQDEPNYLHPELQRALSNRVEVLTALGVSGDPSVSQLIDRLEQLRKRVLPAGPEGEELRAEVYLVYRALARRLTERAADTPRAQVEQEITTAFQGWKDLVLTDLGWRSPGACFRGATILHGLRPFVPTGSELLPLWQTLGIKEPGPGDLVDVLKELAADGGPLGEEQERVMLEALRSLNQTVTSAGTAMTPGLRQKLRWLPLWTSAGWVKRPPVYAVVSHRSVERALADRIPIWQPGGELEQFTGLLGLLGVQRLDAASAAVVDPAGAVPDLHLTESFGHAVHGLQDRLVRDEPAAAAGFAEWTWLADLEVRILPGLRIRLDPGEGRDPLEVPIGAHIDRTANALFLSSPGELRTRLGAGSAVACQFSGARAQVAHRWRDFWEEDEAATVSTVPLTSAGQRDFEARRRRDEVLRDRDRKAAEATPSAPPVPSPQPATGARRHQTKPTAPLPSPRPAADNLPSAVPLTPPTPPRPDPAAVSATPRQLVNVEGLGKPTVTRTTPSPGGAMRAARTHRPTASRSADLSKPRTGGAVPRELSAPLGYQDRCKEKLVLQLLASVLGEDARKLDQRGKHGVGADAVDSAGRYYEIKAHGGPRPNEVTLTSAEFLRAQEQRESYVLILAEYLEEGSGGNPTLLMISDPLGQFDVEPVSDVRLKGLRGADAEVTICEWRES
ncbi:ATP-binding protein [Streptomyces sp. LS1784]|uniref:ATP-binding protein n=1 Tax=Streptomyces sp. LS1784 TaxID=2851533 RepID=UPI001CCB5690|nr:ATP-binding protein [Streptomyces sp. LS1784]